MKYQTIPIDDLYSAGRDKRWAIGADGTERCYLCGKLLSAAADGETPAIELVHGGGDVIVSGETDEEDWNDPGYCGCWPIGPDCLRRIRRAAKKAGIEPTI